MPSYNSDTDGPDWSFEVSTTTSELETVELTEDARQRIIEQIRVSFEASEFEYSVSENTLTPSFSSTTGTEEYGDFERDTMPEMTEPSIGVWYFERLRGRFSDTGVGNIYAGNSVIGPSVVGRTAMREMLLREKAREVHRAINSQPSGEREERAFNEETEDWPIKARAYLADYYVDEYDVDERFAGELESFAQSEGVLNREMMQTTLDCYYESNPFQDENLSFEEAVTVMWLREMDGWDTEVGSTSEVLSEIENHQNFRDWLEREDDVNAAIRGHIYDSDFPSELASEMAPPDEWPDDMDPADMETGRCASCGGQYREVYHHTRDRTWMRNGNIYSDVINLGSSSSPLEVHDSPGNDGQLLCGQCSDHWEANSDSVTVYHNGIVCRVTGSRSILLDHGNVEDSGFDYRTMLPEDVKQDMLELLENGRDDSYIEMEPSDGPGSSGLKLDLMTRLSDGVATQVPSETMFVLCRRPDFGDTYYRVLVKRDNWHAAREAKEMLEAVATDDEPLQNYEVIGTEIPDINV